MSATTIVVSIFFTLLVVQLLVWALFLWIGARWAKIQGATFGRALLVAVAVWLAQSLSAVGILIAIRARSDWVPLIAVLLVGLMALVPFGMIVVLLRATFLRALQAWVVTWGASIAMLAIVHFVVRPYFIEAFTIPTNSMAPTLLGRHVSAVCPVCGKPAYCSPPERRERDDEKGQLMICEAFHVSKIEGVGPEVHRQDRFLVCKLLTPRRWDVIVFRYPEDPRVLYAKRLVGLPGEEVTIKDGCVWIDGRKETPPESLRGLTYASELEGIPLSVWGTEERPAKLGPDESFVLGDFSLRAKDSRLWMEAAPGHPPYAVPASYVQGVVTHLYWPPDRWRTLR